MRWRCISVMRHPTMRQGKAVGAVFGGVLAHPARASTRPATLSRFDTRTHLHGGGDPRHSESTKLARDREASRHCRTGGVHDARTRLGSFLRRPARAVHRERSPWIADFVLYLRSPRARRSSPLKLATGAASVRRLRSVRTIALHPLDMLKDIVEMFRDLKLVLKRRLDDPSRIDDERHATRTPEHGP